jgi:hypothetical protein
LPLHLAVVNDEGAQEEEDDRLELVDALIKAYPDGVKAKNTDSFSWTPLLVALAWNEDTAFQAKIVDRLLKEYPSGAAVADGSGRLPLANTVEGSSSSIETLKALYKLHPMAISQPAGVHDGGLPLHIAAKYGAPAEVIEWLVKTYPKALSTRNDQQQIPLDVAILAVCSVEVEELLVPPLEKAGPELRATKALAVETEDYSTPPMAVAEEVQEIKTRRKEDATDTSFDGAVTICCCSILFRGQDDETTKILYLFVGLVTLPAWVTQQYGNATLIGRSSSMGILDVRIDSEWLNYVIYSCMQQGNLNNRKLSRDSVRGLEIHS